jgi:hypothetical protein
MADTVADPAVVMRTAAVVMGTAAVVMRTAAVDRALAADDPTPLQPEETLMVATHFPHRPAGLTGERVKGIMAAADTTAVEDGTAQGMDSAWVFTRRMDMPRQSAIRPDFMINTATGSTIRVAR